MAGSSSHEPMPTASGGHAPMPTASGGHAVSLEDDEEVPMQDIEATERVRDRMRTSDGSGTQIYVRLETDYPVQIQSLIRFVGQLLLHGPRGSDPPGCPSRMWSSPTVDHSWPQWPPPMIGGFYHTAELLASSTKTPDFRKGREQSSVGPCVPTSRA